jgi:hypothetical protein
LYHQTKPRDLRVSPNALRVMCTYHVLTWYRWKLPMQLTSSSRSCTLDPLSYKLNIPNVNDILLNLQVSCGKTRTQRSIKNVVPFGSEELKFNSHHINIFSNTWSTKCRIIACMSAQIKSNLRDESIKPN